MEEHWGVYMTTLDDMPASIVVNLHVEETARSTYSHCHLVRIPLQTADESGLPEESELEMLHELLDAPLAAHDVLFAGTVTTAGIRDFIFYTKDAEEPAFYDALQHAYEAKNYRLSIEVIAEEEQWRFYDDILYPNIYEQQYMANDDMTSYLQELGDDLSEPRSIAHVIIFETLEMLKDFELVALSHDFTVADLVEEPAIPEYTLVIERVDLIDLEAIDALTYFLINLAEQYNGVYDGWESEVVTSK